MTQPTAPLTLADAAITYGPTGIRCGCGRDAHSNLSPCHDPEAVNDTLPQWLYVRFGKGGLGWHELDADTRSWWAHEAQAVRRAVARNGFKQPDATPPVCGERLGDAVCVLVDPAHGRHVTAEGDYWFEAADCAWNGCEHSDCQESALECGATAADGTECCYIAQHRKSGKPHSFQPCPSV